MSYCLYNAQGEIVCKEHFIRSGSTVYEPFGNVNVRPNESGSTGMDIQMDMVREALMRGCSVVVDKNKGFSITDCKVRPP